MKSTHTLKVSNVGSFIALSNANGFRFIHKTCLPLSTIAPSGFLEDHRIKRQALRDIKSYCDKDITESLSYEVYRIAIYGEDSTIFLANKTYWAGYARGIREQRQEQREKKVSAFDLISDDDIHALSAVLGLSHDILVKGVTEIIAKKINEVSQ